MDCFELICGASSKIATAFLLLRQEHSFCDLQTRCPQGCLMANVVSVNCVWTCPASMFHAALAERSQAPLACAGTDLGYLHCFRRSQGQGSQALQFVETRFLLFKGVPIFLHFSSPSVSNWAIDLVDLWEPARFRQTFLCALA